MSQPMDRTSPPKPRTFDAEILLGVGLVVAVLIGSAYAAYSHTHTLYEDSRRVLHTHDVINGLQRLLLHVQDAGTHQRVYLITGKESDLEPYHAAIFAIADETQRLAALTSGHPSQQEHLPRLQTEIAEKLGELERIIEARRKKDFEAAREIVLTSASRLKMQVVKDHVQSMLREEEALLRERSERYASSFDSAVTTGLITTAMGIGAVLAFVYVLGRNLTFRDQSLAVVHREREQFQVTLRSIGDGVIATDTKGRVTFLNEVAQTLTGFTAEEADGQPLETIFHVLHEESRELVKNPALRALKENTIIGLANHVILVAKDKTERSIADSAAPIRGLEGEILGSVLVFRDVTEQRFEERRRTEQHRLTLLNAEVGRTLAHEGDLRTMLGRCCDALVRHLDGAFARIWILNRETNLLELEASAGLYTHLDGEHSRIPLGQFKIGLIAQNRKPHLANTVIGDPLIHDQAWAKREGMVAFAGYPLLLQDRLIGVMALFARHPLSKSTLQGMETVADSIASGIDRILALKNVSQLAAELSEADRRKNEFLATLAHELRNPLSPLKNAVQLMERVNDPTQLRELRHLMGRQIEQLVHLIDDLMDVSRISRGLVTLRREPCELRAILEEAVEAARPFIEESRHHLNVSMPQEPPVLEADPVRLAQVVTNLLNNAAKYTPAGGTIELTAHRDRQEVVIQVKDNGVGIAPEKLATVFEMFTQIDVSRERGQAGLGIGLTLVKKFVELHGGTVRVESEGPGQGSQFMVRLPVLSEARPMQAAPPRPAKTHGQKPSYKVLVVEDTPAIALIFSRLLQAMGHDVEVAENGKVALEKAGRCVPDVVFSDISMPEMNGYELAKRFRTDPQLAKVCLVAITGYGQSADRDKALNAGFDHHMVKPADARELERFFQQLADGNGHPTH